MNKPAAFLDALVLSLCGCDPVRLELSSCKTAHPGDSCPQEETCPGQCVDIPPLGGWELAVLLWIGPEHVFYNEVRDARGCSECSCAPPEGGVCSATVTIFGDGSCSMDPQEAPVTSLTPKCINIPAGADLGGKTVTAPSYQAGTCEPLGGKPIGSVELKGPGTFCCL